MVDVGEPHAMLASLLLQSCADLLGDLPDCTIELAAIFFDSLSIAVRMEDEVVVLELPVTASEESVSRFNLFKSRLDTYYAAMLHLGNFSVKYFSLPSLPYAKSQAVNSVSSGPGGKTSTMGSGATTFGLRPGGETF